jgi:hypothetical protein
MGTMKTIDEEKPRIKTDRKENKTRKIVGVAHEPAILLWGWQDD